MIWLLSEISFKVHIDRSLTGYYQHLFASAVGVAEKQSFTM